MIRVYNTLTRDKEPFQTVVPGKVGIYLCGPTVYTLRELVRYAAETSGVVRPIVPLRGALATLQALTAELEALEVQAEAAGAPWTPSRMPVRQ